MPSILVRGFDKKTIERQYLNRDRLLAPAATEEAASAG